MVGENWELIDQRKLERQNFLRLYPKLLRRLGLIQSLKDGWAGPDSKGVPDLDWCGNHYEDFSSEILHILVDVSNLLKSKGRSFIAPLLGVGGNGSIICDWNIGEVNIELRFCPKNPDRVGLSRGWGSQRWFLTSYLISTITDSCKFECLANTFPEHEELESFVTKVYYYFPILV